MVFFSKCIPFFLILEEDFIYVMQLIIMLAFIMITVRTRIFFMNNKLYFVFLAIYLLSCTDPTSSNNTPPTASFTASADSGDTATIFQFDASSSHDNEDSMSLLEVRWDWENDGTWDTDYSTTKVANYQFLSVGAKSIKLEVKDTGGLIDTVTKHITVSLANALPNAIDSITIFIPKAYLKLLNQYTYTSTHWDTSYNWVYFSRDPSQYSSDEVMYSIEDDQRVIFEITSGNLYVKGEVDFDFTNNLLDFDYIYKTEASSNELGEWSHWYTDVQLDLENIPYNNINHLSVRISSDSLLNYVSRFDYKSGSETVTPGGNINYRSTLIQLQSFLPDTTFKLEVF